MICLCNMFPEPTAALRTTLRKPRPFSSPRRSALVVLNRGSVQAPPRGHLATPGDVFGFHSWVGGRYHWPWAGGARDAVAHPPAQRTAPTTENYVVGNVTCVPIAEPCLSSPTPEVFRMTTVHPAVTRPPLWILPPALCLGETRGLSPPGFASLQREPSDHPLACLEPFRGLT